MDKDKINRAVHEALGNCVHEWKNDRSVTVSGDVFNDIICSKCEHETGRYAPDYNQKIPAYTDDPRLFWPLVMELFKRGKCMCDKIHRPPLLHKWDEENNMVTINKEGGSDICLAWLKMKGVEINE
jgi:hypothetical protein